MRKRAPQWLHINDTNRTKTIVGSRKYLNHVGVPHSATVQVGVSKVSTHCVSIVIAAHYPVVLCGLATIIRAASDFSVVASCRDVASCISAIRNLSPNLALLDISPPDQN